MKNYILSSRKKDEDWLKLIKASGTVVVNEELKVGSMKVAQVESDLRIAEVRALVTEDVDVSLSRKSYPAETKPAVPPRWWPPIGQRVRLKEDHVGVIWDRPGNGMSYTCHKAQAGEHGVVTSTYHVTLDNGIEISCYGSDFVDPDEQFAERFEPIEEAGHV